MTSPRTAASLALQWASSVNLCSKCEISRLCRHKVTHRLHSLSFRSKVDVMFVGEAPGESEYINHLPFVGPAGTALQAIIDEALLPETSYIITNSILCTPFKDIDRDSIRAPNAAEVKNCSENIQALVNRLKPSFVVALGRVAERSCKMLKIPHYIYVLHPSRIMQSTKSQYEYDNAILNIKRYVYESKQ